MYFQNNLLKPYRHKPHGGGETGEEDDTYKRDVPSMSTVQAEFTLIPGEKFYFYNSGDATLAIWSSLTADAPVPETAVMLAPATELEITVEELGPEGAIYLLINNSTAYEGSIEIALV